MYAGLTYLRLGFRYGLGFNLSTVNPVRRLNRSLGLSGDGQIDLIVQNTQQFSSALSYKMTSSNASVIDFGNPRPNWLRCICTLAKRVLNLSRSNAWLVEQCNGLLVVSIN